MTRKPPKSGIARVDLVGLGLPPGAHRRDRAGRRSAARRCRIGAREARGEVDADAVRPEHVGERRAPWRCSAAVRTVGLGVDVVEHDAVDADRGVGARIVDVARVDGVGQRPPVPDRAPGIAALDVAIEIVPMVEHAQLDARRRRMSIAVGEPPRVEMRAARRKRRRAARRSSVAAITTVGWPPTARCGSA